MMGVNHFAKKEILVGYAKSKNIPSPGTAVAVSGILLLIGGLGIFFDVYANVAALSLVLFLIPVSFKMHAFWTETDPVVKMGDMTHFLKNLALLGAVLTMFNF